MIGNGGLAIMQRARRIIDEIGGKICLGKH